MIIYSIIDVIYVLGTELSVVVVYVDRFYSIASRRISCYSDTSVLALIKTENGQI
jgi:hypothetical protein